MTTYDILLTWDREVSCIWKRKFSVVTILYLVMRYGPLILRVLYIANYFEPRDNFPCGFTGYMSAAVGVLVLASHAVFTSLRIWAIWECRWMVLIIFLSVNLLPPVTVLYTYAFERLNTARSPIPLFNDHCSWKMLVPLGIYVRMSTARLFCMVLADAGILVATWMKTWSIRKLLKSTGINEMRSSMSLSGLILRDGTVYFVTLLCLNLIVLVVGTVLHSGYVNAPGAFIDAFTSIVLCRLILNLRSCNLVDDCDNPTTASNARQTRSLRFAHSVLNNIGASVCVDDDREIQETSSPLGDLSDVTLDEFMSDPLVVGLKEDICHSMSGLSRDC